jgi:rod shape-determining protein MreD
VRFFYFTILFGSALVLQSTIFPFVLPYWLSAGFDLPLLVVIHVAISRGKLPAMFAGLFLGYLQDAMAGGILGVNAISKIIAGYTGGYLKKVFFVRNVAHKATSIAGAVMLSLLSKVAVLALFAQPRPRLLSLYLIWALIGNSLLALGMHYALSRIEIASGIRQEEELSLGD